jgi:crossover junction endodeoxyribonuclease RuvC
MEAREARGALVLLGIDPGLRVTGYGVALLSGGSVTHLGHGAIRTRTGDHPARLLEIHRGVTALLADWRVDELAIETQFVAVNASSAFTVGEARAVSIVAAALAGVPVFEYSPAQVKQAVTSYGRSSKGQIQEMVRLQFGFQQAPEPEDAADALAIAICHAALRDRPSAGPAGSESARITKLMARREG